MNRYPECNCEDFPCCGHYDLVEYEPEHCDNCGYMHRPGQFDCFEGPDDDDEEDDEDVIAMRDPETEHDRDYNYRNPVLDLMEAAEEYDRDTPWVTDHDRGEVYDG